MHTKPEIKEKLMQAEKALNDPADGREMYLSGVVAALRWVLRVKITTEPIDPVTGN